MGITRGTHPTCLTGYINLGLKFVIAPTLLLRAEQSQMTVQNVLYMAWRQRDDDMATKIWVAAQQWGHRFSQVRKNEKRKTNKRDSVERERERARTIGGGVFPLL